MRGCCTIAASNEGRSQDEDGKPTPKKRQAHIIRSLKHPDEVARLRHICGKGFVLPGMSAPRRVRRQTLIDKNFQQDEADRLLDTDAAEDKDEIGSPDDAGPRPPRPSSSEDPDAQ